MPPRLPIDGFRRARARRLRAGATEPEERLWRQLRGLDLRGTHFRRQVPIGNFVADFACMAAKLLIEVDGSQHGRNDHAERDRQRTGWLESQGYRVLRFWNNDIATDIDGVMKTIYAALYGSADRDAFALKHRRVPRSHPTPALRADPPPPGEGQQSS